jgi:hypothetical protein
MKFVLPTLLATVAVANAYMKATLDGCHYEKLKVTPWDNCHGACRQVDCQLACHRAGTRDKPSDYVVVGNYNGPIINSCSCLCYLA